MTTYHITYDDVRKRYTILDNTIYTLTFTETFSIHDVIEMREDYREYHTYSSYRIETIQLANLLHDIMIDSNTSTFVYSSFWVMLRYNVTMSADAIIAMLNSRKFIQP